MLMHERHYCDYSRRCDMRCDVMRWLATFVAPLFLSVASHTLFVVASRRLTSGWLQVI